MAIPADPETLADLLVGDDRRALARALTVVEEGRAGAGDLLRALHPRTGGAAVIGITGAPGAGKSTLTDRVVGHLRSSGRTVAVLAIDPSSPFTGGAILGDRVRMQGHAGDTGVFIRSVSSRGHLGGLARPVGRMLAVLDAAGFGELVVETVGVGQSEVEVVDQADTTVVVVTPGWGDAVQANKAGLLEAGDVFAVNKADRPEVDTTVRDLHQMLDLGGERPWRPPVVTTVATTGDGVGELMAAIDRHRTHLTSSGEGAARRRRRWRREMEAALHDALLGRMADGSALDGLIRRLEEAEVDPWTAAEQVLAG